MCHFLTWISFTSVVVVNVAVINGASVVATPSGNNIDNAEDAETDCALDAYMSCFEPIRAILNCSVVLGTFDSSTCDLDVTHKTLEVLCNLVTDAFNNCLVNLVGSSCAVQNPEHAHLQEWLKPLNPLLKKVCTPDSLRLISVAKGCEHESIFQCLFTAASKFNMVDIFTTKIPQELCANIELQAQLCLATTSYLPTQCKPMLRLLKDLTQEFVDNTQCSAEPVILIPLRQSSSTTSPPDDDADDTSCDLSATVVSECFAPMVTDLKCYFKSESNACAFSLESLCMSTLEAFDVCAMNLIGCGDLDQYHQWTVAIGSAMDQLCDPDEALNSIQQTQELYFSGKVRCWINFFTCFSSYQNSKHLLTFITGNINSVVCREVADTVDYCLMTIGFSGDLHNCDLVLDKIQGMKNSFGGSAPCNNATPVARDNQVTTSGADGVIVNHSIFTITGLIPILVCSTT